MNYKDAGLFNIVHLVLILGLGLLSSCNTYYHHSTTAPPHHGISKKGEISVSAVGGVKTTSYRDFQLSSSAAWSPIKHVVLHASIGVDSKKVYSNPYGSIFQKGLGLGFYHNWDIAANRFRKGSSPAQLTIDGFIVNEFFNQTGENYGFHNDLRYELHHKSWKAVLGAHLDYQHLGLDFIVEGVQLDMTHIIFSQVPSRSYLLAQNGANNLNKLDGARYLKANVLVRKKFDKLELYLLLSGASYQAYVRHRSAFVGIKYNLRKGYGSR